MKNEEVHQFLRGGFLSGCPGLINLATSALEFEDAEETTSAPPVIFSCDFLNALSLLSPYGLKESERTLHGFLIGPSSKRRSATEPLYYLSRRK